jgi:hypothetical protein
MPEAHAGRPLDHVHGRVSNLRAGKGFDAGAPNVEAVYHGPATRSAPSVVLSWD